MKINKIMDKHANNAVTPVVKPLPKRVVVEAVAEREPDQVDPVIFPASDRFKHMLSLIARDNKELYNRIIGLE